MVTGYGYTAAYDGHWQIEMTDDLNGVLLRKKLR